METAQTNLSLAQKSLHRLSINLHGTLRWVVFHPHSSYRARRMGLCSSAVSRRIGYNVTAWHRDQAYIKTLLDSQQLPVGKAFSTSLPKNLHPTADLKSCQGADLTIIALPASAWAEVLPKTSLGDDRECLERN
jgi:hypothetical protein